jgi:hypothetical protein
MGYFRRSVYGVHHTINVKNRCARQKETLRDSGTHSPVVLFCSQVILADRFSR